MNQKKKASTAVPFVVGRILLLLLFCLGNERFACDIFFPFIEDVRGVFNIEIGLNWVLFPVIEGKKMM